MNKLVKRILTLINSNSYFKIVALGLIATFLFFILFRLSSSNDSKMIDNTSLITNENINECSRKTPYEMTPEFIRALSIIDQRAGMDNWNSFKNCLNIQYKNLKVKYPNTEGVFLFDKSVSAPNSLQIYVDTTYQNYDDYLTAVLLIHEITHADQFYHNSSKSCIEKEVSAFFNELALFLKLNEEERNSLFSRMRKPNAIPPVQSLDNLTDFLIPSSKFCQRQTGLNNECWRNKTHELIRNMVTNSIYYQQQCKTQ
ncbi:hypothetical protein C4559_06435 [Candidatus Microgenomates bacterium]|nr:MAG: hypothetical protein C4559_06435 [Candidatus Microgenomates bacterium]